MDIGDRARDIIERVREAERRAGLAEGTVTLVAASKMNDAEAVRRAFDAGIRDFGENRAQELQEKLRAGAYEGAAVHFIGHLQRNKVRDVTGSVSLIQSVDSPELVERVGRRAVELGIVQRILIEVNIGGETRKSGVSPEQLPEILEKVSVTDGIFAEGLMTIPPFNCDISQTRKYFDRMREVFVDISEKKYDNNKMSILSMGMSADFEEAILAGSTMVRIGSAIFGARKY